MNNDFNEVTIDGKHISLNSESIESLYEILNKINDKEIMIKQELSVMLERLV